MRLTKLALVLVISGAAVAAADNQADSSSRESLGWTLQGKSSDHVEGRTPPGLLGAAR
jgi:hypothetical protein